MKLNKEKFNKSNEKSILVNIPEGLCPEEMFHARLNDGYIMI